jgi:hypothetical protein
MQEATYRIIPLLRRDGTIAATTQIDTRDFGRVSKSNWYLLPHGYAARWCRDTRRHVQMHRELLELRHGDGQTVDHINRDKLDNRRSNLRITTHAQNTQNVPARGGSSRFRNVSWAKHVQKWTVRVGVGGRDNRRTLALGYFADELDAAKAAHAWRVEHMPFATVDPELVAILAAEG